MKIECLVEKILKVVVKAERVTGKNLSLPVLSNILFQVGKNEITLRSTNLEVGFEATIPAKIIQGQNGEKFTLSAHVLSQFLSNLSGNKIVCLEKKDKKIKISSDGVDVEMNIAEDQDFPSIQRIKKEKTVKVRAEDISKAIRSVIFCASNSSIKPELSSVYMFVENGNLVLVSTDSFRLAEKKIKAPGSKGEQLFAIVPVKNALEISRFVEEGEDSDVEMVFEKNQIALFYEDLYFVSRVVEGSFPDYRQIIPKENKTTATVLKDDFSRAMKTSTAFSDTFNQVVFKIFPIKKVFEICSKNSDVGSSLFKIKGALEGEDTEISFNHKYINDGLQTISQDSIALFLNGHGKPMIMRGVSDPSFLYLVMPMNR